MDMGFTNSDYIDEILQKALYMGISDRVFDESKKIMSNKQLSFYDSIPEAFDKVFKEHESQSLKIVKSDSDGKG